MKPCSAAARDTSVSRDRQSGMRRSVMLRIPRWKIRRRNLETAQKELETLQKVLARKGKVQSAL